MINPSAGRWTLIIDFAPTVSGTALFEPFTVSLNQAAPAVTATGVPDGNKINVDHPAVVRIKVTNTGTAPEAYFVDGRTAAQTTYDLTALDSPDSVAPLTFADNIPDFLVPSQTTSITGEARTTGTEPIQFDMASPTGDPDLASGQGLEVGANVLGLAGHRRRMVHRPGIGRTVRLRRRNHRAHHQRPAGHHRSLRPGRRLRDRRFWQLSIGGPLTVTPVIVAPGQSATIPVIVGPTGKAGASVSGVIYLDDESLVVFDTPFIPNANTVAAIPYSYVIRK